MAVRHRGRDDARGDGGPTPSGGEHRWLNLLPADATIQGCQVTIFPNADPSDGELIARVDAILDDGNPETVGFIRHSLLGINAESPMASLRLATQ